MSIAYISTVTKEGNCNMKNNKNSSHELTADCIYAALLQLMKTMDYKDITITDITNRAGVSRMAYYRNYADKDEILIKRLNQRIAEFEKSIYSDNTKTEKEQIKAFFEMFHNDPVIENVVKAGLIDGLIEVHRDFTIRLYEKFYGWDMSDENNRMAVYKHMGSMVGLMFYMLENSDNVDINVLADMIYMER